MYLYVVAVLSSTVILIGPASATCLINLESTLDSKTPIILNLNNQIIVPQNRDGSVLFQANDRMQFVCTGFSNSLTKTIWAQEKATCLHGTTFMLDSNKRNYTFDQLKCKLPPQLAAKKVGSCNWGTAQRIQLGFQINLLLFIAKIEVCFDATGHNTYWSKHTLQTSAYSCQTGDTTSFKKDFFGMNPDSIYKSAPDYDKGQLTPKCDYFTGAEQRMTYYYVNAAPQISAFNQKNWKRLEEVIRNNANKNNRILDIYTGTYGSAGNLGGDLPVPQYFWKTVIDRTSGKGVAFIGANDVVQDIANPCPRPTICKKLKWLDESFLEKITDKSRGRIYCCAIQSLRSLSNIKLPSEVSRFSGGILKRF